MIGSKILLDEVSGGPLSALPEGAALLLEFTSGRAIQHNNVTSLDVMLDCDRSGPGLIVEEGGGLLHFGENQMRRSKRGLLIEETRTNFLLNSLTPATQTLALDAGDYVVSVIGAGSATLSGDATGVATEGAEVAFTLVAAGSVTVTVAGQVSMVQLENGSFATSPIETNGAPVTRLLDEVSFLDVSWLNPQNCTLLVEWEQTVPAAGVQTILRWEQSTFHRIRSGTGAQVQVKDVGGSLIFNKGSSPTPPPLGVHQIATALAVDDMAAAWSASITGSTGFDTDQSGAPEAGVSTIYLGSAGSGEVLNGWLRKVVYWPERLDDTSLSDLIH